MADFLANVVQQRRLAQQQQQQQQMMQYRMMQQRQLEAQRTRQMEQQGAVQQRIAQQNDISNLLRVREMENRAEDARRQDALHRRNADRLELAASRGPLRPGYRWKGPGSTEQVLTEGGPEWTKLRASHAGDLVKLQSVDNSTRELVKTIDYILDPKNKNGFDANFGGWNAFISRLVPNLIPGFSHTSDVGTAIDRLTELSETSGLNTVKGNAGQSVGSITEKEWPKFAAQLLKLSPRLDEDTARMFLKEARTNALGIRNREMGAYENEWKPTPFYNKDPLTVRDAAPRLPVPAGVDPQDWAHMSDQDKALWQTPPTQ